MQRCAFHQSRSCHPTKSTDQNEAKSLPCSLRVLPAVADRAPSKQGRHLPGSHIPVISPEELASKDPDRLLVLPWNLINELQEQLPGHELVTVIPYLRFWPGSPSGAA